MWSVNIQHFLDANGSTASIPADARELAEHFGSIVAVVTLDFTGRLLEVEGVGCKNRDRPGCPGKIHACLGGELEQVDWQCDSCGDEGVIVGWEGTLWDCSEEVLSGL